MKLSDTGLTEAQIREKADKYIIKLCERFDMIAERGKGMYVYAPDGRAYLDFYAGIAVNSVGNGNEAVINAVCGQAESIMHSFNYPYTIPQALLAEKICETIGMDKVHFQNSGTEANEAMIKMARKYGIEKYGPNKYNIVTARMSFHGRTFGSMSATGQPDNACQQGFGGMTPGFTYAPFNDLEAFTNAVTDETIAIMIEPVEAEGGVYVASPGFIQGLRKLCDEKGLLLLFDEVQTGWGRTGSIMAYMNYGILPDAVSMAKAMGGGMPIGALAAKRFCAQSLTPGSHGTTFGGHPVCCAAAIAAIDEIIGKNLSENAKRVGDYFAALLEKLPRIKQVRHLGLLVGAEFEAEISCHKLKTDCVDKGLLVTAIGDSILRFVPPLIVTEADCDKALAILHESLDLQ